MGGGTKTELTRWGDGVCFSVREQLFFNIRQFRFNGATLSYLTTVGITFSLSCRYLHSILLDIHSNLPTWSWHAGRSQGDIGTILGRTGFNLQNRIVERNCTREYHCLTSSYSESRVLLSLKFLQELRALCCMNKVNSCSLKSLLHSPQVRVSPPTRELSEI